MRTYRSPINLNPVNPFCAAAEKVAAERKPLQARKKPVKRALGVQSWAGLDLAFAVGEWMNAGKCRAAGEFPGPADVSGEKTKLG
jgi:hypothetical protein